MFHICDKKCVLLIFGCQIFCMLIRLNTYLYYLYFKNIFADYFLSFPKLRHVQLSTVGSICLILPDIKPELSTVPLFYHLLYYRLLFTLKSDSTNINIVSLASFWQLLSVNFFILWFKLLLYLLFSYIFVLL